MILEKEIIIAFVGTALLRLGAMTLLFISCNTMAPLDSLIQYGATPQVFEEGLISTSENHEGLSYISKNKDLIFFTRSSKNFDESGIYISRFTNAKWEVPKKLVLTSSTYEAGIAFSPSMDKAFFTNKAKLKNGDSTDLWSIWEVDVARPYNFISETARPLGAPVNSKSQDCCLTINGNGRAYFSSNRDGTWDIYSADYVGNSFKNVKKMDAPINLPNSGEWPSHVSNDDSILYFSSIRESGFGGDDIYVSHKKNGKWQEPVLLKEPINTKYYEDGMISTIDGSHFFFSSWKSTAKSKNLSNIYIVNKKFLTHLE